MRPPQRPNQGQSSLRDLLGRTMARTTLTAENEARVAEAMRLLSSVELGGGTALDLDIADRMERLGDLVGEALERADLGDAEVDRLKEAVDILAQLELEDGRNFDDLLQDLERPSDRPTRPDLDLSFPRIEPELLDSVVQEELQAPRLGADLAAIANGAIMGLRDRVPDLLPDRPLPAGMQGAALPLGAETLDRLTRLAATGLAARPEPGEEADDPKDTAVLWDDGTSELLVYPGRVRTKTSDRVLTVIIPVATDAGEAEMVIPFAIGNKERVAGLVAAAPDRPQGDPLIAEVWGEALIAFAYETILELADTIAGASGRDTGNNRLVAQGLSLQDGALIVQSQAGFRLREGTG